MSHASDATSEGPTHVAVIGAGTMGAGIAQTCLAAGHDVTLHDADERATERARERIARGLVKAAEKGAPLAGQDPEQRMEALATHGGTLAEAVSGARVVIEAIVEDLAIKSAAWHTLGPASSEDALLATNTSSLSVTELARASERAERFVGIHFFNPVPVLPLVEVVRPDGGPSETVERAMRFAEGLGKSPVACADRPGFLVNRLLIPYLNEAVVLLDEGSASAEAIDEAMRRGANMPIGPLALTDLVGVDVVLAIMETLFAESGDPRYRPAQRLRRMTRAGRLGRKTGHGFYEYGGDA